MTDFMASEKKVIHLLTSRHPPHHSLTQEKPCLFPCCILYNSHAKRARFSLSLEKGQLINISKTSSN